MIREGLWHIQKSKEVVERMVAITFRKECSMKGMLSNAQRHEEYEECYRA